MSLTFLSFHSQPLFDISMRQVVEYLNYFKANYYPNASITRHMSYLEELHDFFIMNNRLPTRREFLLLHRQFCMCPYTVSDDQYVNAASFLLREIGEIKGLSCYHFYFHAQYYIIERRDPSSISEFLEFMRRSFAAESDDPNVDVLNEQIVRAVEPAKLTELRMSACLNDPSNGSKTCGICQEDIEAQQMITLQCGHSYHACENDCCETGTIFTWLQTNRVCPTCRKEII